MTARSTKSMVLVALAALALASASVASGMAAQTVKLRARMTAAQVVPTKPKGKVAFATGTFTGTLSGSGRRWRLAWRITYSRLDHPRIVAADIHYGKPRHFGPIVVRLCGPCKSGQHGVVRVKSSWIDAIKLGNTFITLITGKNPNGEIRGQIRVVR